MAYGRAVGTSEPWELRRTQESERVDATDFDGGKTVSAASAVSAVSAGYAPAELRELAGPVATGPASVAAQACAEGSEVIGFREANCGSILPRLPHQCGSEESVVRPTGKPVPEKA